MIWNCELVKQKSTQGGGGGRVNDPDYAIIQVLNEHEHIIDCIMFAPPEANKTIENANYNNGMAAGGGDDQNDEGADGDGGDKETDQSMVTSAAGDTVNGDDTRATLNSRMTTKERI